MRISIIEAIGEAVSTPSIWKCPSLKKKCVLGIEDDTNASSCLFK